MIDAHTHLNSEQLYPDREQHIHDFESAGGSGLVNIGVNHLRNLRALEIKKKYSGEVQVEATAGIHPGETTFGSCKSLDDAQLAIDQLVRLTYENLDSLSAIGECGIDSHFERNSEIQAIQQKLFVAQCELAKATKLPLVIHSRDNFDLTFDILNTYNDLKIYFHCRGYTSNEIQRVVQNFPQLWIGFCGNVTYPKAVELRESFDLATKLGAKIVLETDAPYLSPQSLRGSQNAPKNVMVLHKWAKEEFGIGKEVFIGNTKELYGWA